MTDPTDLFRPERGDDPLERELRRSLAAHAADAPDAQSLTERLLAAGAESRLGSAPGVPSRPRGWRTLCTPLVAAACVAAIVGIVLAIVRPGHSDHGPDAIDTPSLPVPSVATSAPAAPTSASTSVPSTSTASTQAVGGVLVPLRNVRVVDLTFQSSDSGWALASADCLSAAGRCTAVLRTTDGRTWTSFPNSTHFDVPGVTAGCPAVRCVGHIRFANDSVGYAFGPQAFYLTANGGRSWQKQSGGADALETLDGNVIRVTSAHSGCPGPCGVRIETSSLGSSSWRSVDLPGGTVDAGAVALARVGSTSVLTVSAGTAASPGGRTLFRSADDGAHWVRRSDPCQADGARITRNVTTAADRSVSVLCAGADGAAPAVRTSTDGGVTFGAPTVVTGAVVTGAVVTPTSAGSAGIVSIAAAAARVLVGYAGTGLYRSVDGGRTWRRVLVDDSDGTVLPPGFESSTVGRWVSPDGRTIWTTRDAGAHWTKVDL